MRINLFHGGCTLFCLILCTAHLQGQGVMIGNNPADRLLIMKKAAAPKTDLSDIEGTMYARDSFISGYVVTEKDSFYNLPMKYNIYVDEVEFELRDQLHILEPGVHLKKIQIDHLTLVVEPYQYMDQIKLGYFTLLADGKVKLLSKKVVRLQEMQLAKAMTYKNTPAKFIAEPDEFYIRVGNQPAVKIHKLKKALELFPDHQKSVLSYADRRNLTIKKNDLVGLWNYYNGLD